MRSPDLCAAVRLCVTLSVSTDHNAREWVRSQALSSLLERLQCVFQSNETHSWSSVVHVMQGRATFSERGPDEIFRSSSWAGVTKENPKMGMYIYYNTFIAKQAN